MKPIELTLTDRMYHWFLATWTAAVFGIALSFGSRGLPEFTEPPMNIRQASGETSAEINSLRSELSRYRAIIEQLDAKAEYAAKLNSDGY